MNLAIETHNVRKLYKPRGRPEIVALHGLDLAVAEGTVFGFIGPNGAGKTTCIKILSGLSSPSSGSATIFGHQAGSEEARACLGYLPEIANYHDFMSVEELLLTHARLARVPRAQQREACQSALEAVRLVDRRKSRIRELSKGMQQRFGIAQALVGNPKLLILDEPTSGLDPLAQKEVKDIILALRGRGITIFFSSHKLTEVENICDLICILHRGKLLQCSPLDRLLEVSGTVHIRFSGASPQLVEGATLASQSSEGSMIVLPSSQVDRQIQQIHAVGGSVQQVATERLTLELAFFNLITQAEHRS